MITEIDNLKEEGLVTPEGGEGEKGILEIDLPFGELNSGRLRERQEC